MRVDENKTLVSPVPPPSSRLEALIDEGNIMIKKGADATLGLGLGDATRQEPRPSGPRGSSNYSLLANPPNIDKIRQLMFECKDSMELSNEEFNLYWPFIDNVWVKQRSSSTSDGHYTTDHYICRLRRPTSRPSQAGELPSPEGKRIRKKTAREGGTCNSQIKVMRSNGPFSSITICKSPGSSATHSHDLDHIDKVKRNSGLMDFVRGEVIKGYLPSSVYTKLQEERAKLMEAGGKFLTISDVRNISSKWRMQNPDVTLVPHEGYQYNQGQGIVKVENTSNNQGSDGSRAEQTLGPALPADTLSFPQFSLDFLKDYLPRSSEKRAIPHVTITYASSIDSKISLMPGVQTVLSGPESKLMTHYLRSRHDAIVIGVGTAIADNPGLNCRLEGAGGYGGLGKMWQPRPVVIDPTGRWDINPDCRMLGTAREGKGKAPWIVISPGAEIAADKVTMLKSYGGDYLRIREYENWRLSWKAILCALGAEGIQSVMIEGGGNILCELLNSQHTDLVDSLIVTVAPTYLGAGGVTVTPNAKRDANGKPEAALTPKDVTWTPLGQDIVMCGKVQASSP